MEALSAYIASSNGLLTNKNALVLERAESFL
jgi:hypothetical protein